MRSEQNALQSEANAKSDDVATRSFPFYAWDEQLVHPGDEWTRAEVVSSVLRIGFQHALNRFVKEWVAEDLRPW